MNNKVKFITESAIIAALYVLLTFISSIFGLSSGIIQLRLSEALVALLCFTSAAIPGLTIGCLISNLLTGCVIWDIVFGTVATLIGAVFGRLLHRHAWAVPIPNVISNAAIIPFVLIYAYGAGDAYYFILATVTAGEIISSVVFGYLLIFILKKHRGIFR